MSTIGRLLSKREKRAESPSTRQKLSMYLSGNSSTNSTTNRSVESVDPDSVADFYGLLADAAKPSSGEETKLKSLRQRMIASKSVMIKDENLLFSLRSQFSKGDTDAAYDLLCAMIDSSEGIVVPYDSRQKILGAMNRQAVTCYLDSTLFAMFSRLDSFEAMLYNTFDDRPRNRLALLLRLWVNLLRAGKLITTDITKLIQEALAECGWRDAGELRQQDASEAFTFITEKLKLPLLTLKMDMYHAGKGDDDDHRFVNERLLEVAIPADENGEHRDIKLEDCLEDYFNNRIEVRRFLERRSTIGSTRGTDSPTKTSTIHVETVELEDSDSAMTPLSSIPSHMASISGNRSRAQSIIQQRFVPKDDEKSALSNGDTDRGSGRTRKGSVRKEVLMPAWQFFSLIPWYTNNAPSTDAQVAQHFSLKRPILGLCLKRYSMTPAGRAIRLNTFVDVPIEIGLPHFIQDDKMDENGPLYGNFKLSLQSVVCHRGNSVDSGHYISLVRATARDPTVEGGYWMRFDDLATQKITMIDIHQALRDETPYLLFYQIIPIDGDPGNLTSGERPPSYSDSQLHNSGVSGVSMSPEIARADGSSVSPPGRPSFELTTPDESRASLKASQQPSLEFTFSDDHRATIMPGGSRRPSTVIVSEALNKASSASHSPDSKGRGKSTSLTRSLSRNGRRFSFTLANLTGTSRLKDERPMSVIAEPHSAVEDPGNGFPNAALAMLTVENPAAEASGDATGESERRGRDWHRKRDKSKNRLTKGYVGKPKGEKPDRECAVM